jgi:hypothetical protein
MYNIKACLSPEFKNALSTGITLRDMGKVKSKSTAAPSPYGERLKTALLLAGHGDRKDPSELSRDGTAKLAKAVGITFQATRDAINGKTRQFSAENSARAARFLKVDHFWLATGEGEPRPPGLSEEAIEFARRYDKLDEEGRAKFSAAIILARKGAPDEDLERNQAAARQHQEEDGR